MSLLLFAVLTLQSEWRQKLEAPISLDVNSTLDEAARDFTARTGIPIRIRRSRDPVVAPSEVRRLRLHDIPASSALYWLGKTFEMNLTVRGSDAVLHDGSVIPEVVERRTQDPSGLQFFATRVPPHVRLHPERDAFDWTPKRTLELREKARLVGDLIGTADGRELARRALEFSSEQASEGRRTAFEKSMVEVLEKSVPLEKREAARKLLEEFHETVCYFGEDILCDIVKEHVAPGTWEGVATIERAPDGKLFVAHHPRVQDEVAGLLKALRLMAPSSTITVDALLLAPDPELEKVGPSPLDAVATRRLLTRVAPLRRLQARGLEGASFDSRAATESTADTLSAVGGIDPRDGRLRLTLTGAFGTRDSLGMDCVKFTAPLVLPSGGSALFHLPGRRLLLIHATASPSWSPQSIELAGSSLDESFLARLDSRGTIQVDFAGASLPDVLERFSKVTDLNFLLSPAVPEDHRVTLHSGDLLPSVALGRILKTVNLEARPHRDVFVVSSPDAAPVVLRLLNIRDLAMEGAYDDLAQLIKNEVARDHWEEADGKSIWALHDGTLLIRNRPWVLEEVDRFIARLRGERRSPAALEAIMVSLDLAAAGALSGEASLGPATIDRLLTSEGRILQWITLRGNRDERMEMSWTTRPLGSQVEAASSLAARLTIGEKECRLALDFRTPGLALTTALAVPSGRAGVIRLPDADGRARLLLLRPAAAGVH